MDATLVLEDVQMSPAESDAEGVAPSVAGSLTVGDTSHPLYKGINIIGRESDDADRNRDRLVEWRVKHGGGVPVSALLLRFASISSKHAIIYMEANRHSFVEDLKARNKTFLVHDTGSVAISPGGRYGVRSGDMIKFGNVLCTLHIGAAPVPVSVANLMDIETQPLDVSAAQHTATTSATATPSAPSEPQAHTELPDPAKQQGSGAAGQLPAAAPAPEDYQVPAPAAAPSPAAAAAAAHAHAGGSSRPSSRSSSRRTENLARPTLGFSSGDDVWDGTGGEPEATSQPAADFHAPAAQPPVSTPHDSPEAAAAAAQHADADGEAAAAQQVGGFQGAEPAEPHPPQAGLAAQLPNHPATEVQVADEGATAARPSRPPAAARDSDSDVTRDVEAEAPPSAGKPASSGGWRTKKHRQSQGSEAAVSAGQAAHGSQPVDTAATALPDDQTHGLPAAGGAMGTAAAPSELDDVAAAVSTEGAADEAAVPIGGAAHREEGSPGALMQPLQPQSPRQPEPQQSEQQQQQQQQAEQQPQQQQQQQQQQHSEQQHSPSLHKSQGITGADVADALQMVGNLAAVFPTTQVQSLAPEETEDEDTAQLVPLQPAEDTKGQDEDQALPLDPASAAAHEGTTSSAEHVPHADPDEMVAGAVDAEDPVHSAAAPNGKPTGAAPGVPAARAERQWFEETPAAPSGDSSLPGSKPASRHSSPEPAAKDVAAAPARPSGNGHRKPERRRKTKTPSPAADPDQPQRPARGAQPSSGAKRPAPAAKGTGSRKVSSADKQQQPAGSRRTTRSSPAGGSASPAPAENRATCSRGSKKPIAAPAAPGCSGRKRKAGSAEQPAAEPSTRQSARPAASRSKRTAAQQADKQNSPVPPADKPQSKAPPGHTEDEPVRAATNRRRRKPSPTEQGPAAAASAPAATRKRARAADRSKGASPTPAAAQPAAAEAAAAAEEDAAPPAKKQKTAGRNAAPSLSAKAAAGAAAGAAAVTPASGKAAAEEGKGSARQNRSGAKSSAGKLRSRAAVAAGSTPAQQKPGGSAGKPGGSTGRGAAAGRAASKLAAEASGPDTSPADSVKAGRRRAAASTQVIVRFSKNVGEPLKKEATQKVLRLGGTVTEDDQGFTHFVCLSKRSGGSGFQKSFAALWALAKGVPIVTEMWVEASAAASSFVPPAAPGSNVLLIDKPAEKEHSFDLAVAYQRAQQKPLLADLHGQPIPVFLTPGLVKAEKDSGHGLKELITAAGGSVAAALSTDFTSRGGIALGNEHKAADEKRWAKSKAAAARGTPLFGRSKLIAAIMRQEFDRSIDEICVL